MEQQLDVGVSALEGVALVRPEGVLDIDAAGGFEHEVRALLRGRPAGIVIDLRGITFLDSIGMRSLFRACFWCERQRVRVRVVPGGPAVERILRATGADMWLPLVDEDDEREMLR